jgi:acetyltransferase EpsM
MSTPFVIVGAGGLGREVLGWIANCGEAVRARFKVDAFVSEFSDAGTVCHGIPVDTVEAWRERKPRYLIAVAEPAEKKRIALMLDSYGWQAETFIHDSAAIGLAPKIGAGTIICPRCCISTDATIGEHVLVNSASGVGHDAVVGNYCSLLGAVSVNGNVQVGEGVLFGAGAMVYPGKKVGDWAKVGLGSVVLRNVPANATVFGNPAQKISG